MRLQTQIELMLLGILILFLGASYTIHTFVVLDSFLRLEDEDAEANIERCVRALNHDGQHLTRLAADWSMWDETYAYAQDRNVAFVASNLGTGTYEAAQLDLIALFDDKATLLWGNYFDAAETQLVPLEPESESWLNVLGLTRRDTHTLSGVVLTQRGPMVIGVGEILTTNLEGPARGFVVMGRRIDEAYRERLGAQTNVDLAIWPISQIPAYESSIIAQLSPGTVQIEKEGPLDPLRVYTLYTDPNAEPALLLRARMERRISQQGRWANLIALALTLGVVLVLLFALRILLAHRVTDPIQSLTDSVVYIRKAEDLCARVPTLTGSELGTLSAEFNHMLTRLEEDSTTRLVLTEKLRYMSERDGLTGLLNRREFDRLLTGEWNRARRNGQAISLMMIDVDLFKSYNDQFGHQAGDNVLRKIAGAIESVIHRAGDVSARYGGEEFAVIMPGTANDGAVQLATAIKRAVSQLDMAHDALSENGRITVSIGVSTLLPDGNISDRDLLGLADRALFQAKEMGRGCVVTAPY